MKFITGNIMDNMSWKKRYKALSNYINKKDSVNINNFIHELFFIDFISCDICVSCYSKTVFEYSRTRREPVYSKTVRPFLNSDAHISKTIHISKLLYDNKDLYEIDWDKIHDNTFSFYEAVHCAFGHYEQLIFSFPFYCLHNKCNHSIIDNEYSYYKKYRIMLFNRMFYNMNDTHLFI